MTTNEIELCRVMFRELDKAMAKPYQPYQPKTGGKCFCCPGIQRDNCPHYEGTGWLIDFAAIRNKPTVPMTFTSGIHWATGKAWAVAKTKIGNVEQWGDTESEAICKCVEYVSKHYA